MRQRRLERQRERCAIVSPTNDETRFSRGELRHFFQIAFGGGLQHRELEPAAPIARHILASVFDVLNQVDSAIAQEQTSLELSPDFTFARGGLALMLMRARRFDDAAVELRLIGWPAELVRPYLEAYRNPEAQSEGIAAISQWEQNLSAEDWSDVDPAVAGFLYASVGAVDSAFARLEASSELRSETLLFNMRHPLLDVLRADPRYRSLMQRLGLEP